jgi:2-polyprenyl-3-methyl-5-hydroxy-6-metoxy-1,4-benzoquinol methylase
MTPIDKGNASPAAPQDSSLIPTVPVPCNLCGGNVTEVLFQAKDRLYGCAGTFTYVKCRMCGLVYMNPQIPTEYLSRVYPADYSPHHVKVGRRPANHRRIRAELRKIPFVSSLCAGLGRGNRLLDVGCGSGAFLAKISAVTQCEVQGVDNARAAVETAKRTYGIYVFAGTILEAPFPEGYFDAITTWSYLEHVSNPLQVLRRIHQLLRPGGRCLIGVPNIASFNARVFGNCWYHLDCPRHLYLYAPDTVSQLMQKAGFVVEEIAHGKGTRGLIRSLRYRLGDEATALKYRKNLVGMPLWKMLARPCMALLAWLRQSDLMVVCARKSSSDRPPFFS